MKRFRRTALLTTLVVLATAIIAWAFYATTGAGTGAGGTTGTLNAATISVPTTSTGTHSVTWTTQASLSDTSKNSQITYRVQRKLDDGSFADVPSGPCSGNLPHGTTSCSDTVTSPGSYTYRVIAKYSGWTATSNDAGAVVVTLNVGPAAPTSVALANGGGVGNAYINAANKANLSVNVGLGATSTAADTVRVTITNETNTTAEETATATTGAGNVTVTGIDATSLNDGSVTIRATSSNATGTSSPTTTSVTKDTTAPVSSASSPEFAMSSPFTVSYTATDTGGSGVNEVELWARKAGGSFANVAIDTDPTSPSFSFTPADGQGTYEFYTRAKDSAGNYEAAPANADDSTVFDSIAPAVSSINRAVPTSERTNASSVQWTVTFTESVSPVAAADFALAGTVSGALITNVTGAGTTYTVEATTGGSTAGATLRLDLNDADSSIKDAAGNSVSPNTFTTGQAYTIDKVAPELSTLEMFDDDTDGRVDRVLATFDEALATGASVNVTTGWSSSNRPGGVALGSVSVTGSEAALGFTGGTAGIDSTTPDQAAGDFTISLDSSTGQIRDAAGNKSSISAEVPDDLANPVPFDFKDKEAFGGTNGKFEQHDTATISFTEDVTYPAAASPLNVVLTGGSTAAANDLWRAPGFLNGSTDTTLGRVDYMLGNSNVANFNGSTLSQPASHEVQLTLGPCSAGTPANVCTATTGGNRLGTAADVGNVAVTPSDAIKDADDNSALANSAKPTFSIRLF